MAPFDDTTLATSNISKKHKSGLRTLKIDTTHVNNDTKHRNDRYHRRSPPAYCPPPSYGGEYYHQLSPSYHEDQYRQPHGQHFEFYDNDSPIGYGYPFSTTPIAVSTPQRSNMSSRGGARNRNEEIQDDGRWKHDHNVSSGYYNHPPQYDHARDAKSRAAGSSTPAPPPHEVRRHDYPLPFQHNGWRAPYEHPQEPYPPPEEPYDRHHFSPSPPPPPPYPDHYVPSSEAFSSRSASPSMSWYEGSRGSYDDQDAPVRPPMPHYYSNPPTGGYHYPNPPPQEPEAKERPGTPSSNQTIRRIPTVTPAKPTGRNSPTASNSEIKIDPVSFFSKNFPTPVDKNGASTFAPSSPFVNLQDNDIVCGRGAPTNFHIGNMRFKELVLDYNQSYFVAKRSEKPRIAMKVLDVLKERQARFVRRVKGGSSTSSHWEEVAHKIAYEKVCQALRDAGGPSRQMLSSVAASAQKRKTTNDQSPNRKNGGTNKRQKVAYGTNETARTGGEEGKENCAVDPY